MAMTMATATFFTPKTKRNLLLLLLLLSSLLLAALILTLISTHKKPSSTSTPTHPILRTTCAAARRPALCYASISSSPSLTRSISSPADVIRASLHLTHSAILHSSATASSLLSSLPNSLSPRERTALLDCIDVFDLSLDDLRRTAADLKTPLPSHAADDMKILVSAAMTNQDSCIDGFSHDEIDRELRMRVIDGIAHVTRMCANALAMITNLTVVDRHGGGGKQRGFPTWMGAADMELSVEADVVVAKDGSGDYETVGEAVEAAPEKSGRRYVIRIKEGRYEENVEVGKKKINLMFLGDGRKKTVITGSRNVVDGFTTFKSATLAVKGDGFLARGLTIENTAGPSKHQAVALRVGSDRSAFFDCEILGHQDTLYVHSLRQFYRDCLIAGTVDFIFGNAAAVFQHCDILARRPAPGQKNMVTAHGRSDPDEPTGISIHRSRIAAEDPAGGRDFPTFLGRPWKEFSRTVVMESEIGEAVAPAGWHEWNGEFGLGTLYYGEFRNRGPGAGTAGRVGWKGYRVIGSAEEAEQFTAEKFIAGSEWLGSTGFPFLLGL